MPARVPSDRVLIVAILATALLVRVAVTVVTWDYVPTTDAADYHRHAVSISDGEGYPLSEYTTSDDSPTAFRAPGYPYFLAAVYVVAGQNTNAARLAQALVGTVTVALIGLIAWQLWGRRIAQISMVIAAVLPTLLLIDSRLTAEALFTPLMLGAVAAAIGHRRAEDGYRWVLLSGALAGLATLARPNGFVILPALALLAWVIRPRRSLRSILQPVALLAAAIVVVLPWTIRNIVVMDSFIPFTTQAGYLLAGTYNDAARDDEVRPWSYRPAHLVPEYARIVRTEPDLSEVEIERRLRSGGLDYIRANPSSVAKVGYWNTLRMLGITGDPIETNRLVVRDAAFGPKFADAGTIAFYPLAVLALIGAFTRAARSIPGTFWLLPLFLFVSVVFLVGTSRYRAPIEPFLVMLAAIGVQQLWALVKGRRGGATDVPAAA